MQHGMVSQHVARGFFLLTRSQLGFFYIIVIIISISIYIWFNAVLFFVHPLRILGFGVDGMCDAVFLDLPAPHLALPFAHASLKVNLHRSTALKNVSLYRDSHFNHHLNYNFTASQYLFNNLLSTSRKRVGDSALLAHASSKFSGCVNS